jgi:hypothetical protein
MTSMYGLRLYTYRFYEIDAFVAYQDDVLSCSFQQEIVDMVAGRLFEASPDFDRAHAFFSGCTYHRSPDQMPHRPVLLGCFSAR